GVGFDNIDVAAAKARRVRVCYVPDYCVDEVADHTSAMLLALLRKLPVLDGSVRAGDWAPVGVARPLQPFDQMTVGFLGLGRIGQTVLKRLQPFGFRFVITDPRVDGQRANSLGASAVSLSDLWAGSDALLLHAPSTPETRHIVNSTSIEAMKPGTVLVNCARGDLIDEEAVANALASGQIAAAGLDVFETEPLPDGSPLRKAPNVLLSPHAAWYSERAIGRLQQLAADEVTRFFNGDEARCPVPV
ncbi:MAG: C-terminal binding protein, partial [Pseudomonadota bacterium]